MGCSAAKNITVESLDGKKSSASSNGNGVRKVSLPNTSVPPLRGEDLQAGFLESATVNNIQKGGRQILLNVFSNKNLGIYNYDSMNESLEIFYY